MWIFLLQICPGGKYKSGILLDDKSESKSVKPTELWITFDFVRALRGKDIEKHINALLREGTIQKYPLCLRDIRTLHPLAGKAFPVQDPVFIEMKQNTLEIRIVVDNYSIHFRYMIAFIFKYIANKVPCIKLSFFTKSQEETGKPYLIPYSSVIFDGRNGTLTLDWTPYESGTYIEDIITYITYQNPRIQKFVYGSEEREQDSTAMLERILSSLRYCGNLHVLHVKNHYEKNINKLLELLRTTQIKELDISSWMLEEDSDWSMLLGFLENYPYLESLCISGNYLSNNTLRALGTLVAHSRSLKKLDMEPQDIFTEEGAQAFLEGIDRENSNIEYISLGDTEILGSHWLDIEEKLREVLTNFKLVISVNAIEEESSESEGECERNDDLTVASNATSIELDSIPDSLWDKEQAIEMADFVLTQRECDDGIVGTAVKNTQKQDLNPYMPLSKKQKPNN